MITFPLGMATCRGIKNHAEGEIVNETNSRKKGIHLISIEDIGHKLRLWPVR